ncbi:MAG: hypothetical protein M3N51_06430, partial [Actinomycetota bacterium]|nr:hypothetical protein [Actinomycetota bacterium]
AKPAILAIAPDGEVLYQYVGDDFMDRRPDDCDVLAALDQLHLEPRQPLEPRPAEGHPSEKGARVTRDYLYAYYRGIHFATKALLGRVEEEKAREEIDRTHRQVTRYMENLSATRRLLTS